MNHDLKFIFIGILLTGLFVLGMTATRADSSSYCTTAGNQTTCQTYSTHDDYRTMQQDTNYYYDNTPNTNQQDQGY